VSCRERAESSIQLTVSSIIGASDESDHRASSLTFAPRYPGLGARPRRARALLRTNPPRRRDDGRRARSKVHSHLFIFHPPSRLTSFVLLTSAYASLSLESAEKKVQLILVIAIARAAHFHITKLLFISPSSSGFLIIEVATPQFEPRRIFNVFFFLMYSSFSSFSLSSASSSASLFFLNSVFFYFFFLFFSLFFFFLENLLNILLANTFMRE